MAPAKKARVCIVSFSTFKPTLVTNVPDFYKKKYDVIKTETIV
jgi:long-subunit acyl-CoA synthetase (AMP-forming)